MFVRKGKRRGMKERMVGMDESGRGETTVRSKGSVAIFARPVLYLGF